MAGALQQVILVKKNPPLYLRNIGEDSLKDQTALW